MAANKRLRDEAESLRARIVELEAHVALLTYRVIACGVAASHPDPKLTTTYPPEWDSPQAQEVRTLRDGRDNLLDLLTELANYAGHTYHCLRESTPLCTCGYRELDRKVDAMLEHHGARNPSKPEPGTPARSG